MEDSRIDSVLRTSPRSFPLEIQQAETPIRITHPHTIRWESERTSPEDDNENETPKNNNTAPSTTSLENGILHLAAPPACQRCAQRKLISPRHLPSRKPPSKHRHPPPLLQRFFLPFIRNRHLPSQPLHISSCLGSIPPPTSAHPSCGSSCTCKPHPSVPNPTPPHRAPTRRAYWRG
jgi:hypothetical protein